MTKDEGQQLLELAWQSIRHGLTQGSALRVNDDDYPPVLREPKASFVTLRRDGELRGCIGTLQPCCSLVENVAYNAWAAAFADPRFPPLQEAELATLSLHLSILTVPEPVTAGSESELLAMLRPCIDGLILEEGPHRATFLPAVWEQLPDPRQFLQQLKRKAGLPADYWSPGLRFSRYRCEAIDKN